MDISVPCSFRHTKCHSPPGRKSISQTGMVHPSGPSIHRCTYFGVVHAWKTRLRGASNCRVIITSLSVGVVTLTVPAFIIEHSPLRFSRRSLMALLGRGLRFQGLQLVEQSV